ncbi:MAG TPA: hypothetical protein VFQ98_00710 [Gallionella sp.]|nr:hypothetical protein [Gallionella sp.]
MKKLMLSVILLFANSASALEFTYTSRFADGSVFDGIANQLTISGVIVQGDAQRFADFVNQSPKDAWIALKRVRLDSPGGDVLEAMKLAEILHGLYPSMWVTRGKRCASSCLLLWLAGSSRGFDNGGQVGIHRPTFTPEYLRKLTLKESEKQYEIMSNTFRAFVLKQGLPQSLYEKLIATPSTSLYWLNDSDMQLIGTYSPYYEEKLRNTCGPLGNGREHEFRKCESSLTIRSKAKEFDRIVGSSGNLWWMKARESFLGRE